MATIINCGGSGGTVTNCPFPIGYGGFFQIDPNSIYAGTTWQQKKDVFILAAGDTYPAGSTGGEAMVTLTPENYSYRTWMAESYNATITNGKVSSTSGDMSAYTNYDNENAPHNNMPPYFTMPFWIRTA